MYKHEVIFQYLLFMALLFIDLFYLFSTGKAEETITGAFLGAFTMATGQKALKKPGE